MEVCCIKLIVNQNAKYALACVTSLGVRITPADRMAVHNSNQFTMQATGAETNVLNAASSLGRECLAMTAKPPQSARRLTAPPGGPRKVKG